MDRLDGRGMAITGDAGDIAAAYQTGLIPFPARPLTISPSQGASDVDAITRGQSSVQAPSSRPRSMASSKRSPSGVLLPANVRDTQAITWR
jgi:hypothetical protein